ncbi:uncharacterized protein HMPREF1541_05157 [Cyphellophora europaea CBS 101466]|uniref:CENP-V/GFA domain-containing protein n=1 Tax=Cyphellophora europaea (strain CBS 101466) TaxID=1220924 RepID=W2RWT9_CYPE1|nr:uncharacterized protein HMPREF1541_05157 [Cyphellophora europaea CBS 101466]ETN40877.1 hypothetical protein HMPREF1541_05157 [Cyphellophora europaea CBS 101466]
MSSSNIIMGGCECGRVRYTIQGSPINTTWCYCKQCQRVSGTPFIPFTGFNKSDITWSEQPDVFSSSDIAERFHCKNCGSTLGMWYTFRDGKVGIASATLDQDYGVSLAPSKHIFLKDRPTWFQVPDDGAKRYDEHEADFGRQIREWRDAQGK